MEVKGCQKVFFLPCPHVLFIFLCSVGKYNLSVADTPSFYVVLFFSFVVFSKICPAKIGMNTIWGSAAVEMQPQLSIMIQVKVSESSVKLVYSLLNV